MKETLKNPLYIKILIADIISNFGDILYYLALLNYVLLIDKSNLAISIINLSEILPVLASFLIGYLADRSHNRYTAIIGTLVVRTFLYVVIAVIMGFSPSLLIVIIVSLFNFVSDCVGQYENSLYYPISNRLVRNEVREEVMAFRQSLILSLNILFKAIGGILIFYLSFSKLALVDAASFVISMTIIMSAKKELLKYCTDIEKQQKKGEYRFPNMWKSLKNELIDAIKKLWQISGIKESLAVIPILNAALAIVTPITILCLADNPDFCIVNSAMTISLLAICETAGRVVGSALTITVLKKIKLKKALQTVLLVTGVLLLGIIIKNIYVVLFFLFLASLWTGCIDPKMGAIIFSNLDESSLATTFGGMTTYFQLGDIISKLIFSLFVLLFGISTIAAVYSISVFSALLYITVNKKN